MQDINVELEDLSKQKQSLEESIDGLKASLQSKKQQYVKEHTRVHNLTRQIKTVRTDLQDAIAYFQDPVLLKVILILKCENLTPKKSVENLQRKYLTMDKEITASKVEGHLKDEYTRQHGYLRHQIAELRAQSDTHTTSFRAHNVTAMMENRELIKYFIEAEIYLYPKGNRTAQSSFQDSTHEDDRQACFRSVIRSR